MTNAISGRILQAVSAPAKAEPTKPATREIEWTQLDPDSLSPELRASYDKYRAAAKAAAVLRTEFEARMKAVRLIEDALDEDEVKPEFALKVFDSMADRTEYHRKSTKENINIDFAARLEVAIARSAKVIDANRLDD